MNDHIDPFYLLVGYYYSLSKKTPLMPEFEPSDPLAAIEKALVLPVGAVIEIISMKMKRFYPWYQVNSLGRTGWINSIALAGQDISIFEEKK